MTMVRSLFFIIVGAVAAGTASAAIHAAIIGGERGMESIGPFRADMIAACSGAAIVLVISGWWNARGLSTFIGHLQAGRSEDRAASIRAEGRLEGVANAVSELLADRQSRLQLLECEARDLRIRDRISQGERRLARSVLDSLRDVVVVTNAFDEVVMANEAATHLFGIDRSDGMRVSIDQAIGDETIRRMIADVREASAIDAVRHTEHTFKSVDGGDSSSIYDVVMTSVSDASGEKCGVVTILHDLSREHAVSQMKTDFVAKASHELRTPLTSIRAYVEMLLDGEAKDETSRREFYEIIRNESDRLGRLIDNMLNIGRIEAGIVQIERASVDIRSVIHRAVETMRPQADSRHIVINEKLADVDLQVDGDADMLYQVVLNLVSNAVKYTPEGGRITISADSDNLTRSVVVCVADTGLGIPPDSLDRVFDKFFRIENYSRIAKGTGLGLNLCRHIVETVHNGVIEVESTLGMGSKFSFTIPMRYAGMRPAA